MAFRAGARARLPIARALVIGALIMGASCGKSSIAPYSPDGGARAGSGGISAGSGGSAVASGGTGTVATGGQGGAPAIPGSGGHASGGSGGQAGAATTTSGGQPGTSTGGKGGQANAATGGAGGTPVSTGGRSGRGGGSGSGGVSGTGGGVAAVCQNGDQRCSGNGVQTCGGGQWGTTNACGMHTACTESAGSAQCACKVDPVCGAAGVTCTDATTMTACAQDVDGCLYQTTTVACTTGTCSVAGGNPTCCMCLSGRAYCSLAGSGQGCASSLVCGRSAPDVCVDADWAQWPMPNGPAAVANGAPNAMSFTDNGDGTVTDKITGLMWQQSSFGPSTWSQALAHCPTLTLGGHTDWRLPTRIELLSLVDYSVTFGTTLMVNSTYFPSLADAYYWTSTVRASAPSAEACIVNFTQGGSGYVQMGLTTGYELCVR